MFEVRTNTEESGSSDGLMLRIFYPSVLKEHDDQKERNNKCPIWKPSKYEYIAGIAEYQNILPIKMAIFYDWLIGEKRIPAMENADLYDVNETTTGSFPRTDGNEDESSASSTNKFAPIRNKFPLVVLSHGISGNRFIYSIIASSIASYGYIVAVIEHRDQSASWTFHLQIDATTGALTEVPYKITKFPPTEVEFDERNRQTHLRAKECMLCLEFFEQLNSGELIEDKENARMQIIYGEEFDWIQFKGRLDVKNAAIVGHSFGGATALQAAIISNRGLSFKGCVVLDGWLFPLEEEVYSKVASVPALFINASKWQWRKNVLRMARLQGKQLVPTVGVGEEIVELEDSGESHQENKELESLEVLSSNKFIFSLKQVAHQLFSDFSIAASGKVAKHLGLQFDLEPEIALTAVVEMITSFLCHVLDPNQNCRMDDVADLLRKIANDPKFSNFVVEGTDINISQPGGDEDMAI